MSMTGLDSFDETLHRSNAWLHEIAARMGWDDRRKALRLLRHVLHALRDRMPVAEAAQFAAQLPMLLRGLFYEGWRPMAEAPRARTAEAFLAPLAAAFSEERGFDAEAAFAETLDVITRHVSAGEMADVRAVMPEEVRALFAAP